MVTHHAAPEPPPVSVRDTRVKRPRADRVTFTREPPPLVRPSPPTVGGLNNVAIQAVVRRHTTEVRRCYERGLAQNPRLVGEVLLRILVAADGHVLASQVASSTLALPSVGECIAATVLHWQFPPPSGGGVMTVQYPFRFAPTP